MPKEPAFAPYVLAEAHNWFGEVGGPVETVWVEPGMSALEMLCDGRADVIVGSLLFAMTRKSDGVVCVGQLNARCHHVLAARPGEDVVRADGETGCRPRAILVPGHAPTPAVALAEGLRRAGWPPSATQFVPFADSRVVERQFTMEGHGELALLPLDVAARHDLDVVLSLPEVLGPVPWSLLMTRRSLLGDIGGSVPGLVQVLERAARHLVSGLENLTTDRLPERAAWLTHERAAVRAYATCGLWPTSGQIHVESAQRWADLLAAARVAPSVDVRELIWPGPST